MIRRDSARISSVYRVQEEKQTLNPASILSEPTYLFSSIDNVFGICKSIHAWPANDRMVPWRGMSHFHCAELKKGFSKGHSTEEHLPKRKKRKHNFEISY